MTNKTIMLCAINNIKSGGCNEDCKFCTQSIHNDVAIESYKLKPTAQIVDEAKAAKQNKAVGFCLVTSGKSLSDDLCESLCQTAHAVKKAVPEFNLIACNGIANLDQLKALKKSGIDSYNHNLETSQNFYPNICTTHSWQERFDTCMHVKEAGLNLCCGGIFGLGESNQDRLDLLQTIAQIQPKTVPINFFMATSGLPVDAQAITKSEALAVVTLARKLLPNQKLMAAGGRQNVFGDAQKPLFEAGIDAIVIGDYLTAKGAKTAQDIQMLENYGYQIAKTCR
jgi:biotin synthase